MPDFSTLTFTISDGVATITLNRPEAANGLNMDMGRELMFAALECDNNPEIRCVVLTSAGKMFCAGGDLKSFAVYGDELPKALMELTTYLHSAVSRLSRMKAPLIIAVNGMAAGAGLSLAVCGDLVLASSSAKFTMAYTAAGLSPDGSSSFFLPRLIGLRKTQELMITNRRLTAEEALNWGMVTQICEADNLQTEAQALARKIASGPTLAFGNVKKLLTQTFENNLETQMELESQYIANAAAGHDGKEGIAAFIEKRAANFTGN